MPESMGFKLEVFFPMRSLFLTFLFTVLFHFLFQWYIAISYSFSTDSLSPNLSLFLFSSPSIDFSVILHLLLISFSITNINFSLFLFYLTILLILPVLFLLSHLTSLLSLFFFLSLPNLFSSLINLTSIMSTSRGTSFQYESIDEEEHTSSNLVEDSYVLGYKLKASSKILVYSFFALLLIALINQIFIPSTSINSLPFLSSPYSSAVTPCQTECSESCLTTKRNGKNFCCEWKSEYSSPLTTCSMTFTKNDLCFCTGSVVNKALENKNVRGHSDWVILTEPSWLSPLDWANQLFLSSASTFDDSPSTLPLHSLTMLWPSETLLMCKLLHTLCIFSSQFSFHPNSAQLYYNFIYLNLFLFLFISCSST